MPANIAAPLTFLRHHHSGYAEQATDCKQGVLHQAVRQMRTSKDDAGTGGSRRLDSARRKIRKSFSPMH
jgi:hypothetical protein